MVSTITHLHSFSPPGGTIDYATNDNSSITTAATVAAPEPTNAMKGSNKNCGNWYIVSLKSRRHLLYAPSPRYLPTMMLRSSRATPVVSYPSLTTSPSRTFTF